jgi:hypothetical protein
MPAKTQFVTEQMVRATPLPQHGKSYTVIPHGFVIDQSKKELQQAGFEIKKELYKTTLDGQVAQGVYHLNHGSDADMGLMFAWSNSYNKQMRFKCAIGGHVYVCMNGVVSGDLSSYRRKHTGSALLDVESTIIFQVDHATEHYQNLVKDKEVFKDVILTAKQRGTVLGRLYAEHEILTLTQVGMIKREMDSPSHHYNCDEDSAWAMYNHISTALKDSHPSTYLRDHQVLHSFFVNEFGQLQTQPQIVQPVIQQEEEYVLEGAFGVTFL